MCVCIHVCMLRLEVNLSTIMYKGLTLEKPIEVNLEIFCSQSKSCAEGAKTNDKKENEKWQNMKLG